MERRTPIRRAAWIRLPGAAALLWCAAAGVASGQTQQPLSQRMVTGPPPRSFGQVRIGPVYFTPYVGVSNIGLDTNPYNDSIQSGGDFGGRRDPAFTFAVQAGERIDLVGRKLRAKMGVGLNYTFYSNSTSAELLSGRPEGWSFGIGGLDVEYDVGPRLTVYSRQFRYGTVTDRPNFEIDQRVRRQVMDVGLGAEFRPLERLFVNVERRWYREHYPSDTEYQGIELADSLNGDRDDLRVSLGMRVTRFTDVFFPIAWERSRFDVDQARNGQARSYGFGLRFSPLALVSGDVELGRRIFQTASADVPNDDSLYLRGGIRLVLRDSFAFDLSGQQNTSYSFDVSRVYYSYDWYRVSVKQRVGLGFDVGPYFNVFRSSYPTSDPDASADEKTRVLGGLVGFMRGGSRFEVYGEHWDRDSFDQTRMYNGWRFGFRIQTRRFRFDDRGMFLNGTMGLDRIQP